MTCWEPWHHITVDTNGTYKLCCISHEWPVSLKKYESIHEYWNGTELADVRNAMANNNWNYLKKSCHSCIYNKKMGFISRSETLPKPEQTPKLRSIQFKLNNVCNFACLMCGPKYSNKIAKIRGFRHYPYTHNGVLDNDEIYNDQWLSEFLKISENIEHIKFTGGEPLVNPNFYKLLNFFKSNLDTSKIKLEIITNGSVPLDSEYLSMWKEVEFKISIEAVGERNDYIRQGSNWKTLQRNIQYFKEFRNTNLKVGTVIQALNIFVMDELINYVESIVPKNHHEFVFLINPYALQPQHLPAKAKIQTFEKLNKINKLDLFLPALKANGDANNVIMHLDFLEKNHNLKPWREIFKEYIC